MNDPPPQQQPKGLLPDIAPIISTAISSFLHSSTPDETTTNTTSNAPSSSTLPLASLLPASVTAAPMASWFRKPALKPTSRTAASRDSSPSKSVVFSDRSSTDGDRRQSHETQTTERGRKSKRGSRPKTSYCICYAPPRSNKRIKVRARPLLQLHRLESRARPRPELEVLPSAIFSSRLNKAIAHFSPTKHSVCPSDIAVVRAEKYHEHEASLVDEDESRDILAIISGLSKAGRASKQAKLHLEGGVDWDAQKLPNGGYECTTTDTHGLKSTVRWVPKKDKTPPVNAEEATQFKRFNFSTITAGTRRHPVIANLGATGLEIADVYSVPSASNPRSDSPAAQFARHDSDQTIVTGEPTVLTTDELRAIISTTAIFVALCEGWCPGYASVQDEGLSRSSSQRSLTSPNATRQSFDTESLRRHGSMRQALRSPSFFRSTPASVKHDSRPVSPASSFGLDEKSIHTIPEADIGPPAAMDPSPRRARADTVSTVIIGAPTTHLWRPEAVDDETEDEAEDEQPLEDDKKVETPCAESENSGTTLGGVSDDAEKKRGLSAASTVRGDESPREKKKVSDAGVKKTPEVKKKGWVRRVLLCGIA